ncbi:MAG: L-threonylcarbamoyladenylate synthase [Rubrivivax sp.]|nr:L-threonylcarbamoyladenylate synthase [Rubrivivax sp.]
MPVLSGRDPADVRQAARLLAAGELVAFATETVYGLGARADDDKAVARIYAAKGRPAGHPLIVHVADIAAARHFAASLSPAAQRLIAAFWPGPLTVIVPRAAGRGAAAAGGQDSIGLRLPAHPVALALLREAAALGVPGVAAPSANRFGRVSPTTAAHVVQEFGPALAVLDGGACDIGIESAIVDCTRALPALLRPGQLGRQRIEAVLGAPLAQADAASPRAPGTLVSHYAPAAPVRLFDASAPPPAAAGPGRVLGVYSRLAPAASAACLHRAMPADAATVAHELFAVLRDFDAAGVSAIWVERPPPGPAWDGVRDRLQRAAA